MATAVAEPKRFTLRQVTVRFTSHPGSALFFGKPVLEPKDSKETHDQHEKRTWKQKVHVDADGCVCIPPFAIKNALEESGKFLSLKIPGEGKKTFTDRFRKGVIVSSPMKLCHPSGKPVALDDIVPQTLFVPSDGRRGSGKRVQRIFPTLHRWTGEATLFIADPKITDEVLAEHLDALGQFIGFGSMRIGNGGVNGISTVELVG